MIKTSDKIDLMFYPVGEFMEENTPRIMEMIRLFKEFEEFGDRYVNIVCTGSSGAIIAALFSVSIPNRNRIIHVKKDGEVSHEAGTKIECRNSIYVVVDDFIISGDTMTRMVSKMREVEPGFRIDCLCVSGKYNPHVFRKIGMMPENVVCWIDNDNLGTDAEI
jgi:hypothetical protein